MFLTSIYLLILLPSMHSLTLETICISVKQLVFNVGKIQKKMTLHDNITIYFQYLWVLSLCC